MSNVPESLQRAFESHRSFEPQDESSFESVTTAFDGAVAVEPTDDATRFSVTVTAPLLGTVTDGEMAEIVEDGWYETFERRVSSVGSIFRLSRDVTPTVSRDGDQVVVEAALTDRNTDRGVDDASALIDFVEGTYVQGIIPGYEYTEPVAGLLNQAREAAGSNS
ncbi:MAG: hypothetical protein A07HN63_01876 [uncultured archaeon A07HN63]|nr:MAG: hypothetical protein A07HN63_01876 [uncultured archaeon A07HN63]